MGVYGDKKRIKRILVTEPRRLLRRLQIEGKSTLVEALKQFEISPAVIDGLKLPKETRWYGQK